MCNTEASETVQ